MADLPDRLERPAGLREGHWFILSILPHLINTISVIVKILRTDYFVTTIQAVDHPKKRMIGKWFTWKYFKAKARQRREN